MMEQRRRGVDCSCRIQAARASHANTAAAAVPCANCNRFPSRTECPCPITHPHRMPRLHPVPTKPRATPPHTHTRFVWRAVAGQALKHGYRAAAVTARQLVVV